VTMFGDPLRVAIVGSREYPDLNRVVEYVRNLPPGTTVISGGARGVDATAEGAALALGFEVVVHKPDWRRYGQLKAPLERNKLIARDCDRMVAFWDGKSTGTQHVVGCAQRLSKPVEKVPV
jgi:hypothetical protein